MKNKISKSAIKASICIIMLGIEAIVFKVCSQEIYFLATACILGGLVAAND